MNDYIFTFGTTVHCYDKQCGKLAKVAFDFDDWKVSNLVVEEGMLLKKARVFPLSIVEQADGDGITISVGEDQLKDYPEYRETVVETVQPGASLEPAMIQGSPYGLATSSPAVPMVKELVIEGLADHLEIFDKDTPVEAIDTNVGKVRGLAIAPENGLITHILVHKGTIFVEEFWLSTTVVDQISTKGVFVNMTKDELDNLITYDEERERYWDQMPTAEKLETAETQATPSFENKETAAMHNAIMNDETALAALIAEALMDDSRTEDAVVEVINERGMVTLQGRVTDPDAKQAAEEIAGSFPSVVSVTNELVVDRRQ